MSRFCRWPPGSCAYSWLWPRPPPCDRISSSAFPKPPCLTLARVAAETRETFECFLPLEVSLSDLPPWQLCVYRGSHCAGDNYAGVGVCLFFVVGSRIYEIYRYQSYLGQSCTVLSAEFQGAYLALLIALSFLTWVTQHPRTAVP